MIYQEYNAEQAVIGVFLGGKSLIAGKIKNGEVERKEVRVINNLGAEEEILKEMISIIDAVIDEEVEGIGVGVPSLVDIHKGIVYQVLNIPSWQEVHLKEILEDRFKLNVCLNNDANCFAVGQKYFDKGRNYSNVVGLMIGVGLGCGIIANNQLYSGQNCGAGEFGSIPYRDKDFEYYCSLDFFQKKYGEKYMEFLQRAKDKDKIALALFEQYGTSIGDVIKTILFAIDPEVIIIGGKLADAFPYFEKSMHERLKTFPYEKSIKKLKIEISEEPDILILGAAALYYDELKL